MAAYLGPGRGQEALGVLETDVGELQAEAGHGARLVGVVAPAHLNDSLYDSLYDTLYDSSYDSLYDSLAHRVGGHQLVCQPRPGSELRSAGPRLPGSVEVI